jgi:hypothetical protein
VPNAAGQQYCGSHYSLGNGAALKTGSMRPKSGRNTISADPGASAQGSHGNRRCTARMQEWEHSRPSGRNARPGAEATGCICGGAVQTAPQGCDHWSMTSKALEEV